MRTKLLSFLMLLTVAINYAQSSANVAGIAIQGISRDGNGNARTNTQIALTLKLYYILNNAEVAIATPTVKNADTDGFGVFSLVLQTQANENILIANTEAYLRISDGSLTISDEKLKQVP
ncbi:hypothetical protein, partial [Flavobacterium sp.]|uniref:hypothetical protein n=1 Tax=Flavobacterium sp. TaxID=239 RepID=UPI003C5A2F70